MNLLDDKTLERSSVVANCRMNRERTLTGSNGYATELGFNPLVLLDELGVKHRQFSWLDLCCGSGKALIEAVNVVQKNGNSDRVKITGVDLVGSSSLRNSNDSCLAFVEAPLATWEPDHKFDVITCVHGLHYIGDKLGLVEESFRG